MTNEEAIKILESMKTDLYDSGVDENDIVFGRDIKAINLAIKALEKIPQGEWDKIGEIGLAYKCNKCGEVSVIPTNFCPNCGADMKGGAE